MGKILNEYLNKNKSVLYYQTELQRLIKEYNKHTGRYLFVFATDTSKARNGANVSLDQEDFYNFQDILRDIDQEIIDVYIETPGGSGETAEEIARFLRKKFKEVNFVISGEAKSAGTILALSGDNIFMTDTGSLGPIDAQIKIGRTVVSAHDYQEWVEEKRTEAQMKGKLNPFDAIMISQISPGELKGVVNSLEFAKDLVSEWLYKYKFKNWTKTRTTNQAVTPQMKMARAKEVANDFANHTEWRTHGRSLKIEDLSEKLLIGRIDDDVKLSDIVYRIMTIIRLIFSSSNNYKMYYSDNFKLHKSFTVSPSNQAPIPRKIQLPNKNGKESIVVVDLNIKCPKCGKNHNVKGYPGLTSKEIKDKKLAINNKIDKNDVLICDNCKFALDLKPIKNQIEQQTGKSLNFK